MPECHRETCFWPDAACNLGHLDLSQCPLLKADTEANQDELKRPDAVSMPWSGGVLGLADLAFVAGRRKPTLLAIIGPQNAGKTTLLAAWYLLLARGALPDQELRFCGSRSLAGWEVVASALRWEPGAVPPTFPPHTSSQSTRIPGLLHLALKRDFDPPTDYLMTDAPGEWFRSWAVNSEAPSAEGARWAAEHADAFVLVADREALAGPERGAARTDILVLARRLAHELRDRPVALVWSKADVPIPEETENAVRTAVRRVIPCAVEFAVSVVPSSDGNGDADGLLSLLRWFVNVQRPCARLPALARGNSDPFFMFGPQ